MRRHISDHAFHRSLASMDHDPLRLGDSRIDAPHFAHVNETLVVNVIDRHRDFVGVRGEHHARRSAFVEHRDAIAVRVRISFIGKRLDVIQPNPLTADFVAGRTRGVDECAEEIQRLFAHDGRVE